MKKTKDIAYNDNTLKEMFRDYRRMNPQMKRALEARGFVIIKRKESVSSFV